MTEPSPPPEVPRPWQPRFGLGLIFLVMLVVGVGAAAGSYLNQGELFYFLLWVLAAPMLLMVAMSMLVRLVDWFNRK